MDPNHGYILKQTQEIDIQQYPTFRYALVSLASKQQRTERSINHTKNPE